MRHDSQHNNVASKIAIKQGENAFESRPLFTEIGRLGQPSSPVTTCFSARLTRLFRLEPRDPAGHGNQEEGEQPDYSIGAAARVDAKRRRGPPPGKRPMIESGCKVGGGACRRPGRYGLRLR